MTDVRDEKGEGLNSTVQPLKGLWLFVCAGSD